MEGLKRQSMALGSIKDSPWPWQAYVAETSERCGRAKHHVRECHLALVRFHLQAVGEYIADTRLLSSTMRRVLQQRKYRAAKADTRESKAQHLPT
jgi:hypothetical protein